MEGRGSVILREDSEFFAARSTASCSGRPIWPGIHTKMTDDFIEMREDSVIKMSCTKGLADSGLEIA